MVTFDKLYENKSVYYEILEDGFKIYIGQTTYPSIHQFEPYIPDHTKSYEENAIQMCEDLCAAPVDKQSSIEDRVTNIEANIDYLMLLNDPDSSAE